MEGCHGRPDHPGRGHLLRRRFCVDGQQHDRDGVGSGQKQALVDVPGLFRRRQESMSPYSTRLGREGINHPGRIDLPCRKLHPTLHRTPLTSDSNRRLVNS